MQAARGASLSPSDQPEPVSDPSPSPRRLRTLFLSIAAIAWLADLGTKVAAVHWLQGRDDVELIGSILKLNLVRNPGAAFSTGTSYTAVLSAIAIAAAVLVLWVSRRLGSTGWAIGLGFLLAGIVGNLTDRIFRAPGPFRGHVVDFLELPNWPVFNVADILINVAAGVIILQAVRGIRIDGTRHKDDEGH
ncbi:signal peptidase II [Nocardioides speluncae]|uniref:signal peptidase II n=1 Tax=Nocardioides speluncae TaxID=2670337 RepID=UPI000D689EEE|nr:signal peptidase II [Nocardioides speluncae]